MNKKGVMSIMAVAALLLCSCTGYGPSKGVWGSGIGAATGAIAGQAIGRSTEGTLIGAAAGGLLGYIIGTEIDKYDAAQMQRAYEYTPSYQPVSWTNPDTGNSYNVTPYQAYNTPNGVCREAQIDAIIDGRRQTTRTTACRDNYGNWRF